MSHGTQHQSGETGPHPKQWIDGATCDDCKAHHETVMETKWNQGPGYNLAWLRNSNEAGVTAIEMRNEWCLF